ncbi:hypothetical protein [Parasphingorhabdus sp.]|uniref:hypothetical protein n=1 Tax=Parasphingorhabdus sp. TaxID=2709688 RepID=UPI003A94F3CA
MTDMWLTCDDFSDLADIPERTARYHLAKAAKGEPTKKWPVTVRVATGKGGAAGKQYEVLLSSLPWAYQKLLIAPSQSTELVEYTRPVPASDQSEIIQRRLEMIDEALDYPPRSPERKYELERAAKKYRTTVRTLQRYIQRLEESGGDANALANQRPSNSGAKRVHVSRTFDQAFVKAGYPADQLPELAELVAGLTAAAWQSPAQRHGWWRVRLEAITAFQRHCREQNIDLPKSAFKLSRRRVMETEHHRIVDIRANNRKKFDDMKPRGRRDNRAFKPMEQVVMDVKPLDCVVLRPDGSETWPKLIGFMDTGTHRIFCHFVMLAKGEGVRQEHVIDGFLRMVSDPNWGFPQQVYRDNGTEYYMFDKIRSALAMVAEEGAKTVINAKAYSGASKPIENKFSMLDRAVFSQMEGYAGGDRMNKKIQTLGKPPKPYSGSFDEFVQEALVRIADFENWELKSGPFKGVSPTQCYHDHLEKGWRPVSIETLALDAAFGDRITRRVDRGSVSIKGERFRHPELPNGQTIEIAIPYRRGAYPLAMLPELGWAELEPEMMHLPGDISLAIESSRSQSSNEKRATRLKRQVPSVDFAQNIADRVIDMPTRAAPAPLIELSQSDDAKALADARFEGERKRESQPTEQERRIARQNRQTELLEKKYGRR